eukprot:gene20093-26089_t
MAFFGLTALGPQNTFAYVEKNFRPIPINDKPYIDKAISDYQQSNYNTNSITLTDFIELMLQLKAEAENEQLKLNGKPKPTCEFTSSQLLNEKINYHKPLKLNLKEKQTMPLTATQEYGWQEQKLELPKNGRGGSEITKFASELIKNGIYY